MKQPQKWLKLKDTINQQVKNWDQLLRNVVCSSVKNFREDKLHGCNFIYLVLQKGHLYNGTQNYFESHFFCKTFTEKYFIIFEPELSESSLIIQLAK